MHVYLREEPVRLRMKPVPSEGLVADDSGLVGVAFFVDANDQPSFRALLPPQTIAMLRGAIREPVQLGALADEPEAGTEIRAMVGICVQLPADAETEGEEGGEPTGEEDAPWRGEWNPDGWKGGDEDEGDDEGGGDKERTALLTFAPLVRLERRFPFDFAEELADLLESALAGKTKPVLEARVDNLLKDL